MSRASYLAELRRLRRHLDSIVERAFVTTDLGDAASGSPGSWSPAVDLYETADEYVLSAEVPGVEREDLDLEVEGRRLTLAGRRRPPGEAAAGRDASGTGGSFHRLERHHGPFRRSFLLDHELDADDVRADLEAGVLTVRLTKRRKTRHRVEVQNGEEIDG